MSFTRMSFTHRRNTARSTPRLMAAVAALVVVALVAAACGSSGSGGTGSTATSGGASSGDGKSPVSTGNSPRTGASDAELAAAKALVQQWYAPLPPSAFKGGTQLAKKPDIKGKTVYLVPLSYGIPVIHAFAVGVEQALTTLGAKYKVCDGGAGGQPNPTSWGNCLKTALDQRADAVMSMSIDYEADATQFDALAKAGIPTLIAAVQEKGLTPKPGLIDFFDLTGWTGTMWGNLSTLGLAEGGKNTGMLWLRLLDSTATTTESDAGVAKFKQDCAACGIYTADFTTANSQAQLAATVSAMLVKHPDITVIAVPVDGYTPLAIQGIQQAGKTGKVQVVSSAGSLDTFQRIKDGTQIAALSSPNQFTGWLYTDALMQLLAGMPVAKGNFGLMRAFDKSNINTIKLDSSQVLTDNWFTDGQPYIQGFLNAWGFGS